MSYVFMSTPLYNPYLSFKTMGSQDEGVKEQAERLPCYLDILWRLFSPGILIPFAI